MANEISIQLSGLIANGSFRDTIDIGGAIQLDQANPGGGNPGTIVATTGGTDVAFTGLTAPALCFLRNLDPTNYVEFGPKSGSIVKLGKLRPGGIALLELATGVTLTLAANTASCDVLVKAWEL